MQFRAGKLIVGMENVMSQLCTLHIDKEAHKFSAAHYTIFDENSRERLHGHNFDVSLRLLAPTGENGFSADYNVYKNRIALLCEELDEYLLLAADSPYQTISDEGENYRVQFAGDSMLFLKSDTLVLPIRNVTVEELSRYLLEKMRVLSKGDDIREMELGVASGQGQRAWSSWRAA